MPKASLVVLLLGLSLLVGGPAVGQDANETAANESTANETAVNETGGDAGTPAAPEPLTIVLTGHGEGGSFFFRLEGQSANNPRLVVRPGQEVTVTLKTVTGAIHNFCTEASGQRACTTLVSEGDEASVTFTAPQAPGSFEYWCDPHRGSGMKGTLVVAAEGSDAGGGDAGGGEQFAGETVDLGDLGYPDCAGTKIPAASAQKAVGGPTVSDYVQKCRTGDSGGQGRETHPADYVIPGSFALIALGVVGMVWVSRRYRP